MKITDKKELVKIISFLAMSDGSIHKNGGSKNYVFSLGQTEDHKDLIDWVEGIINNITTTITYTTKRKAPRKNMLKVQSKTHPFFNKIRDRVYVGNYKSVDIHALKLLDWQALAILYMCDGCLGKYEKDGKIISYSTTINLCRLSYGDQLLLKKAFKDKFDLEWNIVKTGVKYYALRLRKKDLGRFIEGIRPYVLKSFEYKLDFRTVNP